MLPGPTVGYDTPDGKNDKQKDHKRNNYRPEMLRQYFDHRPSPLRFVTVTVYFSAAGGTPSAYCISARFIIRADVKIIPCVSSSAQPLIFGAVFLSSVLAL